MSNSNNPRKFSEKIALHTQKQAEETAAFEQIMREVRSTTSKRQERLYPDFGGYRAGSLPNVNALLSGNQRSSIDLPNALSTLSSMTQGSSNPFLRERVRVSPTNSSASRRRIDTSPYGSKFLSPPETSWRRIHSDPSLHATTLKHAHSPISGSLNNHRRSLDTKGPVFTYDQMTSCKVERPNSCDVKEYPSHFPVSDHNSNVVANNLSPNQVNSKSINSQCSISPPLPATTSSGSLPDLSNVTFVSPIRNPLDLDEANVPNHPFNLPNISGVNSNYTSRPNGLSSHNQQPSPLVQSSMHAHPPSNSSYGSRQSGASAGPAVPYPSTFYYNRLSNPLHHPSLPLDLSQVQRNPFSSEQVNSSPIRNGGSSSPASPESLYSDQQSPISYNENFLQHQQMHTASIQHQLEYLNMSAHVSESLGSSGNFSMSSPLQNHSTFTTNPQLMQNHVKIPDIVLTSEDDKASAAAKDVPMSSSIDLENLLQEESFNLVPLDSEALQMLNDDIVTDPAVEESFRLDRM